MAEATFDAILETGYIWKYSSNWDTAWSAAIGETMEGEPYYECIAREPGGGFATIGRGILRFDTSELPDDCEIQSATLKIAWFRDVYLTKPSDICFVGAVGCGDEIDVADYGFLRENTDQICDPIHIPTLILETYYELELNSTGLALISKTGQTRFGIRGIRDIENLEPTTANKLWVTFYGDFYEPAPNMKAQLVVIYSLIATPTATTNAATSVGSGVGTVNGTLDSDGGEACTCGFEWGETVAYGNTTPTQSRETGQTFTQALAGLDPDTTYHFRAFATNSAGTGYGDDATFTTDPPNPGVSIPTVTTDEPSVAQEVATLEGTLVDNGGEDCSCYLEWGRTTDYGTTEGMGSKTTGETFSQQISGLIPNTEYHYRAYAVNSAGTGYGDDKKFITQQRPVVNFSPVENRAYALSRWER